MEKEGRIDIEYEDYSEEELKSNDYFLQEKIGIYEKICSSDSSYQKLEGTFSQFKEIFQKHLKLPRINLGKLKTPCSFSVVGFMNMYQPYYECKIEGMPDTVNLCLVWEAFWQQEIFKSKIAKRGFVMWDWGHNHTYKKRVRKLDFDYSFIDWMRPTQNEGIQVCESFRWLNILKEYH